MCMCQPTEIHGKSALNRSSASSVPGESSMTSAEVTTPFSMASKVPMLCTWE